MATKTISVRIAGKKGKVDVEPRKGATVADVLSEAAALLARFASQDQDAFQNRVLSAMRLGFGGHLEKSRP